MARLMFGDRDLRARDTYERRVHANPDATYACVNLGKTYVSPEIEGQGIAIDADIHQVLKDLLG